LPHGCSLNRCVSWIF